jgi:hypothetical protein
MLNVLGEKQIEQVARKYGLVVHGELSCRLEALSGHHLSRVVLYKRAGCLMQNIDSPFQKEI